MDLIALIPTAVILVMLFRWPLPRVFLGIFLPLYFVLPSDFYWKAPFLPPITITEAVLLPMGVAVAITRASHWRFTRADIPIALFLVATFVADLSAHRTTIAIFRLFAGVAQILIPYMIGKLLIEEEHLRLATLRRCVIILAAITIPALWEYKMGINPFLTGFGKLFPDESFGWKTQIRWGFGRVSGPFAQSELAGIIFLFGLISAVWLAWAYPDERPYSGALSWLRKLRLSRSRLCVVILSVALATTQARGPWLGFVMALPIALMGRSKKHLRYLLLSLLFLIPVGAAGYVVTKVYLADGPPATQEQENAQYRGRLLTNYIPVAKMGGLWGWGSAIPVIDGQDSIDNQYLLTALGSGSLGLFAFVWICCESLLGYFLSALRSRNDRDRSFAYSLLGVFAGILLTISTVYLGTHTFSLFFLLAGWSQGLKRHTGTQHPRFDYVLA